MFQHYLVAKNGRKVIHMSFIDEKEKESTAVDGLVTMQSLTIYILSPQMKKSNQSPPLKK